MSTVRRLIPTVSVVLVILAGGMWLGGHPQFLPAFVRHAVVDDQTDVVAEAMQTIEDVYYRPVSGQQLADTSIKGMVAGLNDRFSNYFTPKEYRSFQEDHNSQFSGIGMAVSEDPKGLLVNRVYDGSPAARVGIRPGDIITAANGRSLKGLPQERSTQLIKGPPGSEVRLTFEHKGKPKTVTATRATINVPMVESKIVKKGGKKIGVVALAQFGSGAHAEVYAALKSLEKKGARAFVFDLRGNGGGLVSEAQLIASAFIRSGPIVTTKGRSVPARTLNATGDPVVPTDPLVVLVDKGTASASEIVTGALQDDHRATVVGTHTFGKGVFQQVLELSNGGALDITAGQYFTPKGRNLGGAGVKTGAGIKPDIPAKDNPDTHTRDEGLDKALAVVAATAQH
ncbi:MAG: family peptidase [Solirubrobacterales bacterium]|nr:family peptidase [Solirubrobacterales bacterium]